jgi:hypothetical protein
MMSNGLFQQFKNLVAPKPPPPPAKHIRLCGSCRNQLTPGVPCRVCLLKTP